MDKAYESEVRFILSLAVKEFGLNPEAAETIIASRGYAPEKPDVNTPSKITENERNLYIKQKSKARFATAEEENSYAEKNERECSKCNLMKKLNEYSGNTSGCDAFDKEGYRLRRPECKDCNKKASKGKSQAIKIANSLGIPHKAPEHTKCTLCGNLPKKGDELVFDHCHKTNTFRGYLHNSCNRSLGVLGDDVPALIRALNFVNMSEKRKIRQDKDTGKLEIEDCHK